VQLMLGQASRLLAIGIVLGTVAAIAAGRTVAALLFGIGSHDAATFVAAAVLLAAIGLAAAYVPTARAARISPLDGLRAE
jgi:putative ABC transport system permease protein